MILFPTHIWIFGLLSFITLTVAPNATNPSISPNSINLLDAFRAHYAQFEAIVRQVHAEATDPFLLQLLGEDLNQFSQLAHEHVAIFEHEEAQILQNMIHPDFLRFAYRHRTTSGLSHFLDVPRSTLRRRLLESGIASPGTNPFPANGYSMGDSNEVRSSDQDELLNAEVPQPAHLPDDVQVEAAAIPSSSSTGYITNISDEQLDSLLGRLCIHFHRAGIRILDGMLRRLNIAISYERIRHSLICIDPVHRVFDRIRIRRRGYSVPGPNSLWHHDGHHRKSVHNVRIERLWVDVSHYCSQTWHDLFTLLEMHHGLQVSNLNHIWLLQHLFLPMINEQLSFWAESWNNHRVSQRLGPARSPEDMFVFDSLVNGVRGDEIGQFTMTDEELEVFGVDWEGLQDETLLRTLRTNYAHEGSGSWLGRRGPPSDLNEVPVNPPSALLTPEQIISLNWQLQHHVRLPREQEVVQLWIDALAIVKTMYPDDL
ncbi:uncharacterized protein C8R40DRAFT_1040501 [Lentinula edodes]|uniref:uncharacterized protein n=1 Tax=Lentinula edodes TaxID=5353 RepID=UPI001E8EDC90|nr:uncharacterized protein C8R40DRAFT_1040501 [Lentinula edodes]KAH7877175.1 hypothetical protein C8R40DRAFT_1040501 [Lentinula edodes]